MIRTNCRPTIPLAEAKRTIFSITQDIISCESKTNSHVTSAVNYALLANPSLTDIDIATIRLHMYCVIGNIDALKKFILSFTQTHGFYATKFLLNTNIKAGMGIINCSPFHMTPMFCALLWNNNPLIIRLLYSYGAKPNSPDINNLFIEERFFSIPFFNHINPNNSPIYWRDLSQFSLIAQEIRGLSGEHIFDKSWIPPTMAV